MVGLKRMKLAAHEKLFSLIPSPLIKKRSESLSEGDAVLFPAGLSSFTVTLKQNLSADTITISRCVVVTHFSVKV